MAADKLDRLGPLLSAIGEQLASDIGVDPDGIYLYVEVGDRWISANVFRDEGSAVRYYRHGPELTDLIWDVWGAEPDAKKRWSVMEYEIRGTKFDAQFRFPDEVDVESFEVDRREVALKARYGGKPVVYPPMPEIMK